MTVLALTEVTHGQEALVGGKAAQLGELSRFVPVPTGFCMTTECFPQTAELTAFIARLQEGEAVGADIRALLFAQDVSFELPIDETMAYAVRSSATAEDLPTASFAGQYDSYLHVVGREAVRERVRACWASLFSDRAINYRVQQQIDHRTVKLAVIVQQMVQAEVSGVMFTANPVTGVRSELVIEAVRGVAEQFIAGEVNGERYVVGETVISDGSLLTTEQVRQLAAFGRRIEAQFGAPQDIEWCFAHGQFYFVQSRPITTLFPIPETTAEGRRVYVSVGHQQMMTDAMKPLGLSVYQLVAMQPMYAAGGRLFVDATMLLSSEAGRARILALLGQSEPLVRDALETIIAREGFLPSLPNPPFPPVIPQAVEPNAVATLMARAEAEVAEVAATIATKFGAELFAYIREDIGRLKQFLADPQSMAVIMTAFQSTAWLNERMEQWLGEKNVADRLTQSVPNNVTSEMGLALLDVADGRLTLEQFLAQYGMRCNGEIDITRPRWFEQPEALRPLIERHAVQFAVGERERKFVQGREAAEQTEAELVERLRQLPDGEQKVAETREQIATLRQLIGYREYPKYVMMQRFWLYKQAIMREVGQREDVFYLTFNEVEQGLFHEDVIAARRAEYRYFTTLTPPRVLTSDGEMLNGRYTRDDVPDGALIGLGVSSGIVEGRVRIMYQLGEVELTADDILVTPYTDPSWTPLFVGIKGLITEVGGLMTHGSVIAREYGLPAVVGVDRATKRLVDGQRVRLDGTNGIVEVL